MSTIVVAKGVNFRDIEEINSRIVNEENVVLRIPNSLNTSGIFGIEGLVLQAIATWLRTEGVKSLHTYIQEVSGQEQFSAICNSLYGIVALALSDEILTAAKGNISKRESLLQASQCIEMVREEKFSQAFKGFYLSIPSIKAPSNNSELKSPFYNSESIVDRRKFLQLTKKALSVVIPKHHDRLDDNVVSNISEIIRELFTNTHKHGRTDEKGNILEKNFRAVNFRSSSINKARLNKLVESGGGNLALFVADWMPEGNKTVKMLDITIVDSGPGYARRWTGLSKEKLDYQSEINAVVSCFKKYKSTEKTASSGSGLSNVLRDLQALRGWFRLRTGSTEVEKSFFNREGSTEILDEDVKHKQVFVEGVVFNIIIPFESAR